MPKFEEKKKLKLIKKSPKIKKKKLGLKNLIKVSSQLLAFYYTQELSTSVDPAPGLD